MGAAKPNKSVATLLGADIGGTSIRSTVVQLLNPLSCRVLSQTQQLRPRGAQELVEAISQIADDQASGLGITLDAVGVGCAGFVQMDGVVMHSPNIASINNFPLRQKLEEKLTCPIAVENDAAAAAWAEAKLGVGAQASNVVFLGFGTGIGGALVIDGRLCRGVHGFGTEPGHMTVEPTGPACQCGRKGCWELFASGTALGRYAQEAVGSDSSSAILELAGGNVEAIRGEHVTAALAKGDPTAQAVFDRLYDWIAVGLNNIVTLVDPELVILGGGLSDMGDDFLAGVRSSYRRLYTSHDVRQKLRIELASYGENSGAVGAALLAGELLEPELGAR